MKGSWNVAATNEKAEHEAVREDAPKPVAFMEGDLMSIVPVFKDVDSDEEEAPLRLHLQADFDEAVDSEWLPVASPPDDIPDLDGWEAVHESRMGIIHNPHHKFQA